jgi:hypothetical protein
MMNQVLGIVALVGVVVVYMFAAHISTTLAKKVPGRKRYLVFAALSFMFSVFGFSGDLGPFPPRWKEEPLFKDPVVEGLTLLALGLAFLYFYFNPKEK